MWSIVARYTTLGEAEAARCALDAAGFETDLRDEHFIGVNWFDANAVGWVKLFVPAEAHDDAFEVLTSEAKPEEEAEPVTDAQVESAPASGTRPVFLFFALTVFAIGVAVAAGQTEAILAGVPLLALILLIPRERPPLAPPPTASDAADIRCPRCGLPELHRVLYRRLAVVPLVIAPVIFLILPVWFLLPGWKCDNCGRRVWFR